MRAPVVPMSKDVAWAEVRAWTEKVATLLPPELAEVWRELPTVDDPWRELGIRLAVLGPVFELLALGGT